MQLHLTWPYSLQLLQLRRGAGCKAVAHPRRDAGWQVAPYQATWLQEGQEQLGPGSWVGVLQALAPTAHHRARLPVAHWLWPSLALFCSWCFLASPFRNIVSILYSIFNLQIGLKIWWIRLKVDSSVSCFDTQISRQCTNDQILTRYLHSYICLFCADFSYSIVLLTM